MKFICNACKRLFHYTAKTIEADPADINGKIRKGIVLESAVCPYCFALDFTEYIEESKTEAKMVDMQDIEVAQVKEYLEKGYVMLDRYAKAIRMALYKKPAEEAKQTNCIGDLCKAANASDCIARLNHLPCPTFTNEELARMKVAEAKKAVS